MNDHLTVEEKAMFAQGEVENGVAVDPEPRDNDDAPGNEPEPKDAD